MANVLVSERQISQELSRGNRRSRLADLRDWIGRGFSAWRAAFHRCRAEAEIRRKLADVDDHILRDIGLVRTKGRIESIDIQRCLAHRRAI